MRLCPILASGYKFQGPAADVGVVEDASARAMNAGLVLASCLLLAGVPALPNALGASRTSQSQGGRAG